MIGVNIYPNLREKTLDPKQEDFEARVGERTLAAAGIKKGLAGDERCFASVKKLAGLVGLGSEELFEAAVRAAGDGATLGMICRALLPKAAKTPEIQRLRIHRAASDYERLRQSTAAHAARTGTRPRVFLANFGPVSQHKARADFSTGFFEVGGFEVIGSNGFNMIEEAAAAAVESGAEIVVICSTDETYPEIVPGFAASLRAKGATSKLILAGYPKEQIDAHKAAGVDEFIHLKANNYEVLVGLLKEIGVAP